MSVVLSFKERAAELKHHADALQAVVDGLGELILARRRWMNSGLKPQSLNSQISSRWTALRGVITGIEDNLNTLNWQYPLEVRIRKNSSYYQGAFSGTSNWLRTTSLFSALTDRAFDDGAGTNLFALNDVVLITGSLPNGFQSNLPTVDTIALDTQTASTRDLILVGTIADVVSNEITVRLIER